MGISGPRITVFRLGSGFGTKLGLDHLGCGSGSASDALEIMNDHFQDHPNSDNNNV